MFIKYSLLLLGGLLVTACHRDSPAPAPALAPVAAFTFPATSESTVAVPFQNQSQNALTYKWSFGDGTTDRTAEPTHTYAKAGTYQVTLRAYGAHQDSAVVSQPITVNTYDVIAHTTVKIAGTYDYKLYRRESQALGYAGPNYYAYLSAGVLTVTQKGQAISITAPTFTTQGVYDPTGPTLGSPPAPGLLFKTDLSISRSIYGVAYFYSAGDSLLITQAKQSSSPHSDVTDYYRARRRP